MLYFLLDSPGSNSSAEEEWLSLGRRYPRESERILMHVQRVEATGGVGTNRPLQMAQRIDSDLDLYYWEVEGKFVVYSYDGEDLVIILVGDKDNYSGKKSITEEAERRI